MTLRISLLHCFFFFLLFLLLPPTLSLPPISKPGCLSQCGNLSIPIPFPFGVGSDCSLDPYFNIYCKDSKPYLSILDAEIVVINQTYIRVKYPNLVSVCYDEMNNVTFKQSMRMNLSGTPFWLSGSNRLMAVGCDDLMLAFKGRSMFAGCSLFCEGDRGGVGYCTNNLTSFSNGCCDVSINFGEEAMEAQLIDMSGKLGGGKRLYSCSHAFITEWEEYDEKSVFSYPFHYLDDKSTPNHVLRLDWFIVDADNCSSQAKRLCPNNSFCVDSFAAADYPYINQGYFCSCKQGYDGNPYVPGGCQPTSAGITSVVKTECLDQCGELPIPYPFGVGKNCYLAPSFNIHCNTSSSIAYLVELDHAQIIELNSTQVRVSYPLMGMACYNVSSYNQRQSTEEIKLILNLSKTQYTLSDQNVIRAVGCHDMLVGIFGDLNRTFTETGCAAVCEDQAVYSGYCSKRSGCCKIPIPRGTNYLEAKLSELREEWPRRNFSCSFAFVEGNYDIEPVYSILYNPTQIQQYIETIKSTVVLDWRIGGVGLNCQEAKENKASYACIGKNSVCVDNFDAVVGGYHCNCSKGYVGNPYVKSGCKDIDECGADATNPCVSNSKCNNTVGSVTCLCPKGYNGDGRKDGTGCFRQQTKIIILVGMSSGVGFMLLILLLLSSYKALRKRNERKLKAKFFRRNGGLLLRQQTNEGSLGKIKLFSATELEAATDHFNADRIIGRGGQGTVYKGMLSDGKIVAIKKAKMVDEKQLDQFINEVVILSQINHKNVVRLLGCCLEIAVPLLVYEFMPNGTLFDLIHDSDNEFPLTWNMRLKIATDIAGALAYLHSASCLPIYHRDIKSDNILLDEKYIVKVSDFGISRSVVEDQTHVTTMVKGTFGYLDPEYFQSSQFTEKSDVYSFGVVLVELLTGQRPISLEKTEEERGLAPRFRTSMEENCLETILDPHILEQSTQEEVARFARLAHRCLNLKGRMRPTMKEVATELESFRVSQMPTIAEDGFEEEEKSVFEDMQTISDIEYTWKSDNHNVSASSSETHPLTFTK